MAIFSSAFLKLKRARQIIDELEALLAEHIAQNPPTAEFKGIQKGWAEYKGFNPPAPEMTAVLIGDVVHNVRTALDHMASEMARMNHKSDKHVHFPFAENAGELRKMIGKKNFDYCGDDAVELLKTFKPYRGGNADLRAIHDLDIRDKHRALAPEPHVYKDMQLVEWDRTSIELGPQLRPIHPKITNVAYTFAKDSEFGGRPIVSTLKEMVSMCEGILKAFARLKSPDECGSNEPSNVIPEA